MSRLFAGFSFGLAGADLLVLTQLSGNAKINNSDLVTLAIILPGFIGIGLSHIVLADGKGASNTFAFFNQGLVGLPTVFLIQAFEHIFAALFGADAGRYFKICVLVSLVWCIYVTKKSYWEWKDRG